MNHEEKSDMDDEYDDYIADLLDILSEETASEAHITELLLYIKQGTMNQKPIKLDFLYN